MRLPALRELVLVGGGGHCRSLIDAIEATQAFRICGFVDLPIKCSSKIFGYEWLGSDDDLAVIATKYSTFMIGAGQTTSGNLRKRLFTRVIELGGKFPVIISPHAVVSRHAIVSNGTAVLHHALVNAGAQIGQNVIVNSGAIVEHDTVIGDHCHISTGARVNGGVRLGTGCFVGSGAVLKEGISLAEGTVVGAGAVLVLPTTEPFATYVGVPARRTERSK